MRDRDIRQELTRSLEILHQDEPDTLIINELGVCQGQVRIDLAVVNGLMIGYEIKSERDTLERLPVQAQVYSRAFDEVSIVINEKHLSGIQEIIPEWWGVLVAGEMAGRVVLEPARPTSLNPHVDVLAVLQFLWRDELLEVLEANNLARGMRNKSRQAMCHKIAEKLSEDRIKSIVRQSLKSRVSWRSDPQQRSSDVRSRLVSR